MHLQQRVGGERAARGPVDRLRERLQDNVPLVHGVGLVGVQAAVPQGPRLSRRQGYALLDRVQHAAQQFRGRPELQGRFRSFRCVFPLHNSFCSNS